ncbi:hypothetical protein PRIPAC_70210 [Pristionchus pacificus]|uniref:G protein-coupled receptor n=1 Tax=Pristionchus pacificus TaxID=54126 RepID=A0A2A6C972_PRIPA|nr:hypothetical protein PRIPAC_70210 [Pristionchus pacificus]|eukprot:PDM74561.1 G protein-coupled receptor [Pristionchus pacificus]
MQNILQTFADFCEGLASFIGAVYRLPYYLSDDGCYKFATPLECMVLPHNIIWRFSDTGTAFMLVAIAVDRFFAITFPIFYVRNSNMSNLVMIIIIYGVSIFCMLYAWRKPMEMQFAGKTLQRVCSTGGLIDPLYTIVVKYATGAASALSAIIHLIVTFKVLRYISGIGGSSTENISRKDVKFTITTMIKGATTILFDSIPRLYGVYAMIQEQLTGNDPQSSGFGSFLFAIPNINSILNVFIYAGGQPEVRKAVLCLIGLGKFVITSEDNGITKGDFKRSVTEKFNKEFEEKIASYSEEARIAAKKFHSLFEQKMSRAEIRTASEKLQASLPEKVKKELETMQPMKDGRLMTSSEFFDFMGIN